MTKQFIIFQTWLKDLRDSERGATAVEYALLIVFIAVVMAAGAVILGGALRDMFTAIGGWLGVNQPTVPTAP